MSEHMGISGYVNYYHLPADEEWGFTYCRHCKETCNRVTVEFHEGMGNWMKVICNKCMKTIWVASLNGRQKYVKDDRKCNVCKKLTNQFDCYCYTFHGGKKYAKYYCSKKCENTIKEKGK